MELRHLIFLGSIFLFIASCYAQEESYPKHTEKPIEKQYTQSYTNMPIIENFFFKQPLYTRSSIKCFLKHTYNHSKYSQNFLSLNFSHIITFLSYSSQSDLPRDYIARVIGLFGQKLKATMYVNAYAFSELLEKLPELIKSYFNEEEQKKAKTHIIKQCLYSYLLTDFKTLKEEPDKALDELSCKLYDSTFCRHNENEDISILQLQQAIIHFIEIALSKLIWDPKDQQEVWLSVKHIAHNLEVLLSHNIIPHSETLDTHFWTLLHRFCYLLEIEGAELNEEFYQLAHKDMSTQQFSLWTLQERESFITSKKEFLRQALLEAEVRARAYQAGIIADTITTT